VTLFDPGPVPGSERKIERHYARLLTACGLSYWPLPVPERQRIGRIAARLRANGIPERRIVEEGARLKAALGRRPTLTEITDRLLP
jgi:hypothetical protein